MNHEEALSENINFDNINSSTQKSTPNENINKRLLQVGTKNSM